MDRFQSMSVFVAVAEESCFAAAARRLRTSAPTVTRAVGELEAHLGARLLHRTTRNVQLTEAGNRYLADCRAILSAIHQAEENATGIHQNPKGNVSITASLGIARRLLPPILLDFLERYPELNVTGFFADRVVNLLEEGLDVAIRIAELPDSNLAAIRVGYVRKILCASPAYLEAQGIPKNPKELTSHRLIDFDHLAPNGEWEFNQKGKRVIVRPEARLRVNSADVAIEAAKTGKGITRVLSYMVAEELVSGTLEPLLEEAAPKAVPVYVLHKDLRQTSAAVRALVDHLTGALRSSPAIDHR